jgi:hypothetical protein
LGDARIEVNFVDRLPGGVPERSNSIRGVAGRR